MSLNKYQYVVYITKLHERLSLVHTSNVHHIMQPKLLCLNNS